MKDLTTLTVLLEPALSAFSPKSLLLAGETSINSLKERQDTRLQCLKTPFTQQQLTNLQPVDVAVISNLTETLPVKPGQQWLGYLRNVFAPHVILIADPDKSFENGWQFCDLLALGLHHVADSAEGLQLFSYAIENYQPKRDWLNSRFWANPENYDKYRW